MSAEKVNTTDHVADLKDPVRDVRNSLEPAAPFKLRPAEHMWLDGWNALAKEIYAIGKASGFYDHPHTDLTFNHGEKIALMHSELSEALEGLRAGPFPGKLDDKLPHLPMVEVEMADTIIRIMNYCSHCGLDVASAVLEKARYNATRGHRHGGKHF